MLPRAPGCHPSLAGSPLVPDTKKIRTPAKWENPNPATQLGEQHTEDDPPTFEGQERTVGRFLTKACNTPSTQLARSPSLRLNAAMRGGTVLVLLGVTALVAYSVGHQNVPVNNAPVAVITSPPPFAKPVTFGAPVAQAPISPPLSPSPSSKVDAPDKSVRADTKRKVEAALTAAAITAIIIQVSRDQYHAGGRPCACPDDTARNGSACGGRSAYSRPGGAAPLCYPSDVTAAMIDSYRQRQAAR